MWLKDQFSVWAGTILLGRGPERWRERWIGLFSEAGTNVSPLSLDTEVQAMWTYINITQVAAPPVPSLRLLRLSTWAWVVTGIPFQLADSPSGDFLLFTPFQPITLINSLIYLSAYIYILQPVSLRVILLYLLSLKERTYFCVFKCHSCVNTFELFTNLLNSDIFLITCNPKYPY